MGLMFFPRGGSSHVAQNLAAALPGAGWEPTILSGSLSLPGRPGDARAFYRGLDVHTVDFTRRARGPATRMRADPPFHPSYEDRAGRAGPRLRARSTTTPSSTRSRAWARALAGGRRGGRRRPAPAPPDAAQRGGGARRARRPGRRPPARHRAADARGDRGRAGAAGRTAPHGQQRMRALGGALRAPDRALRQPGRSAPSGLLGIDAERCVAGLQRLRPRASSTRAAVDRAAHWRRAPRRRAAGLARRARRRAASRYAEADLEAFADGGAGAALRRALHRGQARRRC